MQVSGPGREFPTTSPGRQGPPATSVGVTARMFSWQGVLLRHNDEYYPRQTPTHTQAHTRTCSVTAAALANQKINDRCYCMSAYTRHGLGAFPPKQSHSSQQARQPLR